MSLQRVNRRLFLMLIANNLPVEREGCPGRRLCLLERRFSTLSRFGLNTKLIR
jgi:hypothetical protein